MRDLLEKKNFIVNISEKYQNKQTHTSCFSTKHSNNYLHPLATSDCKLSDKR